MPLLKRSFVHLPGVGGLTEAKLHAKGVDHWDRLREDARLHFKAPRAARILEALQAAELAYRRGDAGYFSENLPRDGLWRMIPEFADRIAYLDIETTGLGHPPLARSTTITFLFRGELFQEHQAERKRKLLKKVLKEAALFSSFFGEAFDIPFLAAEFGLQELREMPHIDLCFWLKRLGYKGGLKRVQKRFPEISPRKSLDIDGYDAVRLWRMHEKGVPGALETLLTYNAEDVVVLEPLLVRAFNLELARHEHLQAKVQPLPTRPMAEPVTRVSLEVYGLLRGEMAWSATEGFTGALH